MKILKTSERVKVKIGEIALILAPMKQDQKLYLSGLTKVRDGYETNDINAQVAYAVKTCVKGVEGVTDSHGEPVALEFGADGVMSDDSHTDLMVIVTKAKGYYEALFKVAGNELPGQIKDLITGEIVEGAEVTVLPKT